MNTTVKYYVNCHGKVSCRGYASLDIDWFRQSYAITNDYSKTTISFFDCVFALGVL